MVRMEVNFSGGELGCALANDPEELAYALKNMVDWDGADLGEEVARYLFSDDADVVAAFLRAMAEKIEEAGTK